MAFVTFRSSRASNVDKLILKGNDGKEVKALITRRARIADKN